MKTCGFAVSYHSHNLNPNGMSKPGPSYRKPVLTFIGSIEQELQCLDLPVSDLIDNPEFSIIKVQHINPDKIAMTPTFRPDHFTISVHRQAYCKYYVGNDSFELVPNTLFFSKPNVYTSSRWNKVKDAYNITFTERFFEKYSFLNPDHLAFLKIDNAKVIKLNPSDFDRIEQVFHQIWAEYSSGSTVKYTFIANLINVLLFRILNIMINNDRDFRALLEASPVVLKFLNNVDRIFSEIDSKKMSNVFSLKAKDYAGMQGLHSAYLSNLLRGYTGHTISQWVSRRMLNDIQYLLKMSNISFKHISNMYGFTEVTYFHTFFKRNTGTTPNIFRQKYSAMPKN